MSQVWLKLLGHPYRAQVPWAWDPLPQAKGSWLGAMGALFASRALYWASGTLCGGARDLSMAYCVNCRKRVVAIRAFVLFVKHN